MNRKTLIAALLLGCLPLLSQPLLAADKPAAKPATTVTSAKEAGKINLNTASAEVIWASNTDLDWASASQLVQVRDSTPFKSIADAAKAAGNASAFGSSTYSVTTQYFEARGRLRLGENVLSQRSLLQRKDMTVTTLWQEQADWGMPPVARR